MRKLIYSLFIFCLLPEEAKAQTQADSLYIAKVDSIVENIGNSPYNTYRDMEDTVNHITGRFKNGQLVCFYYIGILSNVFFYLHNDSLIYVGYTSHAPDIRGSFPENTYHKFYFKNDKQIHYDVSHYSGGHRLIDDEYYLNSENLLKEFYYYKNLLLAEEESR